MESTIYLYQCITNIFPNSQAVSYPTHVTDSSRESHFKPLSWRRSPCCRVLWSNLEVWSPVGRYHPHQSCHPWWSRGSRESCKPPVGGMKELGPNCLRDSRWLTSAIRQTKKKKMKSEWVVSKFQTGSDIEGGARFHSVWKIVRVTLDEWWSLIFRSNIVQHEELNSL